MNMHMHMMFKLCFCFVQRETVKNSMAIHLSKPKALSRVDSTESNLQKQWHKELITICVSLEEWWKNPKCINEIRIWLETHEGFVIPFAAPIVDLLGLPETLDGMSNEFCQLWSLLITKFENPQCVIEAIYLNVLRDPWNEDENDEMLPSALYLLLTLQQCSNSHDDRDITVPWNLWLSHVPPTCQSRPKESKGVEDVIPETPCNMMDTILFCAKRHNFSWRHNPQIQDVMNHVIARFDPTILNRKDKDGMTPIVFALRSELGVVVNALLSSTNVVEKLDLRTWYDDTLRTKSHTDEDNDANDDFIKIERIGELARSIEFGRIYQRNLDVTILETCDSLLMHVTPLISIVVSYILYVAAPTTHYKQREIETLKSRLWLQDTTSKFLKRGVGWLGIPCRRCDQSDEYNVETKIVPAFMLPPTFPKAKGFVSRKRKAKEI